jgi:DNA-binding transcriptional ArsR family regulator
VSEPPLQLCEDAAATFAILASAVRIRLLWLLARGESDVGTLAARAGAGVTSTSQHLAKLRLAGLVSVRVEGKRHVYVVDDPHVISLVGQALDHHADLRGRTRGGQGKVAR